MDGVKQFDYNYLLIKHLDRMSQMVTYMGGEMSDAQGFMIKMKEGDKGNAFGWSVDFLTCIVPEKAMDAAYRKELSRIASERAKAISEVSEATAIEQAKQHFDKEQLHNLINLLNRRGFLLKNQIKQLDFADTVGEADIWDG